eukprot:3231068-Rhodomonas_salina.1
MACCVYAVEREDGVHCERGDFDCLRAGSVLLWTDVVCACDRMTGRTARSCSSVSTRCCAATHVLCAHCAFAVCGADLSVGAVRT